MSKINRNLEQFKTNLNIDPLYYTEMKNNDISFSYLKKKYGSELFPDSQQNNIDNILTNTTRKKAICAKKLNKNEFIVRIPQSSGSTSGLGDMLNYYNKSISTINNFINDDDINEMSDYDCKRFYSVYCENVKKDLDNAYPSYTNADFIEYAPECACYAKTAEEILGDNIAYLDEINQNAVKNLARSCQLPKCNNNWNPEPTATYCPSITLCSNNINLQDIDVANNFTATIQASNNCSSSTETKDNNINGITNITNDETKITPDDKTTIITNDETKINEQKTENNTNDETKINEQKTENNTNDEIKTNEQETNEQETNEQETNEQEINKVKTEDNSYLLYFGTGAISLICLIIIIIILIIIFIQMSK
jgi:hypothetical protein